jgi:hypothetical protein
LWAKWRNAENIFKSYLFTVGSVCRVKHFTASSTSFKDFKKSATSSPRQDCDRSNCAAGGSVDSSWQDNGRQCSNCTRVLPWYSIQHNACSVEVSEVVAHSGCPENWRIKKKMNRMCLSLQHLLRYANEGEYIPDRIVSGDESVVHHYHPELNRASM